MKSDSGNSVIYLLHFRHGAAMLLLPMHYHDPFDRILIVQAMLAGLTIITNDRQFERYPVDVLQT